MRYSKASDGTALAIITHQTFRGTRFNKTSCKFVATNETQIISALRPACALKSSTRPVTLYVRGLQRRFDQCTIFFPNCATLDKILLAIKEYNDQRG